MIKRSTILKRFSENYEIFLYYMQFNIKYVYNYGIFQLSKHHA